MGRGRFEGSIARQVTEATLWHRSFATPGSLLEPGAGG